LGADGESPRTGLPDDETANPHADPDSIARSICLRLLTVRSRTRSELADELQARYVPADAAERVLRRFTEVGLVDDAAFAATFVSSRRLQRGLSGREIARQLRTKGVQDSVVSAAVTGIDPDSERHAAEQLVRRKLRSMANVDQAAQIRRLVGMLARKGYSQTMAYQVVRDTLLDGDSGAESDDTAWLA
jgi:regulatory protein